MYNDYFSLKNDKKCCLAKNCMYSVAYTKNMPTNSLKYHLEKKHPALFQELMEKKKIRQEAQKKKVNKTSCESERLFSMAGTVYGRFRFQKAPS